MSDLCIMAVKLDEVLPHPNADRLDLLRFGSYTVCDGRGKYMAGDIIAHFPPDMLIPNTLAKQLGVEQYLKEAIYPGDAYKSKCRVSAIRLRGCPSFGFILPVDAQPGDDLTERFHGVKFEPPEPLWYTQGQPAKHDPRFHCYTEIESWYNPRNKKAIPDGTPVRITEKIHGCVVSQTRVRMADGSNKYIRGIQPGEYVIGVDEGGKLVPSKVLQIFQNGPLSDWLKIKFLRQGVGHGNSFGSITCTPNHQFLIGGAYIPASNLKVGDELLVLRGDWQLGYTQEQILLGKMLGDGSLAKIMSSAHIAWGHVNRALTDWTAKGLGDLTTNARDIQRSGYGSLIYRARTHNSLFILNKFGSFIREGRKVVPEWVSDELSPISLAFWYMDDGSLGHHVSQEDRAHFAVCGFTEQDCQVLIRGLRRFNIIARYYSSGGYSRLRLNANDAEKLFALIVPYIPSELQYKLPERYRGCHAWLPQSLGSYTTNLIPQKVTSIESISKIQQRWDLETETHNYLPSNIVTHNSNSRVGLIGGEFMCGSHKLNMKEFDKNDKPSTYWQPLTTNLKDMLYCLAEGGKNVIAFGEIFGSKVQCMDYGIIGRGGYRLFDISVNGEYLPWEEVEYYATRFCVPTVPLLYTGPFTDELVNQFVDGPTTVAVEVKSKFKGREGIVITPLVESFSPELGGRMILKAISVDYLQNRKTDSH